MPFVIGIAAAAAAYHFAKQNGLINSNKNDDDGTDDTFDPSFLEGKTSVDFLPMEQSLVILEPPIRTITFYEGSASNAARVLWDRLAEIVEVNPWLSGWLVRDGKERPNGDSSSFKTDGSFRSSGNGRKLFIGRGASNVRLWYDESGATIRPGMFHSFPRGLVHLSRETPYTDFETVLSRFEVAVKSNKEVINNVNETVFQVSIIPEYNDELSGSTRSSNGTANNTPNNSNNGQTNPQKEGFALIVSMSHLCGDGHTFYKIYNMLLGTIPITQLNPQRNQSFDRDVSNLMGIKEANYASHIASDPSWEKYFWWNEELFKDTILEGRIFEIDEEWLKDMKSKQLQTIKQSTRSTLFWKDFSSSNSDLILYNKKNAIVQRLSTNDILVSTLWNKINPSVGMMMINLRNRVESAKDDCAGNYTNSIAYTAQDYETPQMIRKSVEIGRRAGAEFESLTALPRARKNTSFSVVTSWVSFQHFENQVDTGKRRNKKLEESAESGGEGLCSEEFQLVRHMPLHYTSTLIKVMPQRMSYLNIFASGSGKIGCFVIAPKDAILKIESTGIAKEVISKF